MLLYKTLNKTSIDSTGQAIAITAGFLAHLKAKENNGFGAIFPSICVVVALFMEVSYWSAMVLANSSFKFCRSVVKSLSLSSKFSNSCSTYIFLLRGVMLQLFSGSPERWCVSTRMNTRTFWASFIETGHHRPYLESLRMSLLSCNSFEIFRQSKYNIE